jgi:hypothetical protein
MTPWLITLAVSFAGWGVALLLEKISHGKTREALAKQELATSLATAQAKDAYRQFNNAAEDAERLRLTLTHKTEELDALSLELAHCNVPGAAADRLRRLLRKDDHQG